MSYTAVYRVERPESGLGPYCAGYGSRHEDVAGLHEAHNISEGHPGPWQEGEDFAYCRTSSSVFGFPNRAACDWWFESFEIKLRTAGYVVNVYEVPYSDVVEAPSGKQVMFTKDYARLVDTQSTLGYSRYYQTN